MFESYFSIKHTSADKISTKWSLIGATCYVLWGILHLYAGYSVYQVAKSLESSMAKGRVLQDAWNLFFFGIIAIYIALYLNIRNNRWGYWINMFVTSLADTGLIFFILIPGYMPLWPGLVGPILWIFALISTTIAYLQIPQDTNKNIQ